MQVFDFAKNGKGSAVISAVAGSGKTTTIVECAQNYIPKTMNVLFLAFNKSIVSELGMRLKDNRNVDCMTLHSLGFKAIMRSTRTRINVHYTKYREYIQNNLDTLSGIISSDTADADKNSFIHNVCNLLDKCRINLIKSNDIAGIEALAEHHSIDVFADEVKVVSFLLETAYEYKTGDSIDFNDMLTLPCTNSGIKRLIPKYDFVLIDECQDLNKAQRELMLSSLKKGGRFIAVGDRNQAINGFAGAGCDSFDLLAELAKQELPLSVNYRCGKNIINLAQSVVPQIQAFEGSSDGEVIEVSTLDMLMANDMVLCRKTAPLIRLCLKMLANNISANVKGRDMGDNLIKLIERLKPKNILSLYEKLQKELQTIIEKQEKKQAGKKNKDDVHESIPVTTFMDKIECITAFAENSTGIADLKKKIEYVFSDENKKNAICLSTVHRSKGLEADRVFLVCPDKLPLKWKGQQEWEYQQEMNLKYVAITRAKKLFVQVNLDEDQLANYDFKTHIIPPKKAKRTRRATKE